MTARVAWLDEHGISRQIMYPNTGGFSSQMFFTKIADDELRNVCIRTYNDAAAALQTESGGRLVPLSQMPWWDIAEAEKELERTVTELGLTAGPTMFSAPELHGLPSLNQPQWTRFLSICEELDVPLSFHIGKGTRLDPTNVRERAPFSSVVPLQMDEPLALMVFFALCAQCASTLVTIWRETGTWRWAVPPRIRPSRPRASRRSTAAPSTSRCGRDTP